MNDLVVAFDITALVAIGMAIGFVATDYKNPISCWMGAFLGSLGIAIISYTRLTQGQGWWWGQLASLAEVACFTSGVQWGIGVARDIVPDVPTGLPRLVQWLGLPYLLLCLSLPEQRHTAFVGGLGWAGLSNPMFWAFAFIPILNSLLLIVSAWRLWRLRPDRSETSRINALVFAMPLLSLSVVMPPAYSAYSLSIGEMVFLFGMLRYHVVQAARGQFMSRFLSPQVADLVRQRGLENSMEPKRQFVTVVCCDIRGFTAHTQGRDPESVMRLLRDFYASVGTAAGRYGATIKDLAGDGVLMVVGAPVPFHDHADRALELGQRLQSHVRPVLQQHSPNLGLGVGIASGTVATGVIGQRARLEYVAIGAPVNLASRLCADCLDGEVRVDAETFRHSKQAPPLRCEPRPFKGLIEPVPVFIYEDSSVIAV